MNCCKGFKRRLDQAANKPTEVSRVTTQPANNPLQATLEVSRQGPMPPECVLIIDDDPGSYASLRRILKLDGYEIDVITSIADAIDSPHRRDYFVILLDRKLPDGNAEEILPQLKQMYPEAAVMIVTGHADLESTIIALRHGADDYLLKPLDPAALRVRLKQFAEFRRTKRHLHDRDARLRAILETAVEGIISIDESGVIESLNPAAEAIFGYAAGELLGQPINCLMPSPHDKQHDGYITDYLRTGVATVIGSGREVEGVRKDGTTFAIDLSVNEVLVGNRKIFTGFIRDITERKLMEQSVREQRDFAESLIETAHAIVLVLDTEARIVRFNAYLEELTGFRMEDVRGGDWFEKFLPSRDHQQMRAVFDTSIRGDSVQGNINAILTQSGIEREIAWWCKTMRDVSGKITGVLCVGHDVTEFNRAQQRALQAERLAAIGQMVTGLAHESRNAIQRAQACQEMLAMELEDEPELANLTVRTQQALDDLHRLYEEVRSYAAPIKLDLQDCDLAQLWQKTWSHLEVMRSNRTVELQEERNGTSLQCRVDKYRLEQVFRNILENALAACATPGKIVIKCADADIDGTPGLQIALCDNGPGLDEEQARNIFEPFFTTRKKGTGLGMAIARRIVEAHGGQISVGRCGQPGAEIVIRLPRDNP